MGDLDAAIRSADRALELDVKARPALVLAARVAAKQGDSNLAKEFSSRAARLGKENDPVLPDDTDLIMRRYARSVGYLRQAANFYKGAGEFQKAMESAKLLAERRPDDVQNWQMLTWLALAQRQLDVAGKYAQRTLKLDPKFAPAWEALSRSRMAEKNIAGSLVAIEKGIAANPKYTHAYVTRGIVLGVMKKWPASLQSLEKGMESHPQDVEGLISLAAANANLGHLPEARTAITKAVKLAPNHPLARRVYIQLHQKQ